METPVSPMGPVELPDPIDVAASITGVLEGLGVRYLIGGSLASSVHGEPRSTNDVDILVDFQAEHIEAFVEAIRGDYYVSEPAVREAVRSGHHFNVIHMDAAVKVDFFLAGDDPFDLERLDLRQPLHLPIDPETLVYVDTAEHSVLRKLEWFRRGAEVSERQWRDVVAILRIQGSRLDQSRLRMWAPRLGVADLLERAFQEATRAD
jgi:predicted nucleotidyltransferase